MGKTFWLILALVAVSGLIGVVVWGFGGSNTSRQVAGYSIEDPNAPKVEITEKRFDFGKIQLTDIVKHEFKLKNVGKNPLIITDLMTSCHCTTVIMKVQGKEASPEFGMHSMPAWQGEISAGTEAALEVIYEPAKMPVHGAVSRVISFSSNDPANKNVQLEIVGVVE